MPRVVLVDVVEDDLIPVDIVGQGDGLVELVLPSWTPPAASSFEKLRLRMLALSRKCPCRRVS